jgi:thiosulfate/3-mercaptopyruvate sulfurtransferase
VTRQRTGALIAGCLAALSGEMRAQAPRLVTTSDVAWWLAQDSMALVVVDVRQSWTSYLEHHLPRAVWLNVETLRAQSGDLPFQLLSADHYAELFRRLRITPSRQVVIYSAGDQADIDATFAAWLLASAGATRVLVLDGGYAKWELEGRPLTQAYPHDGLVGGGFRPGRFHPDVASLEDVRAAATSTGAPGPLLVDARPPEQFSGAAGAQARRGHIPGAVNHPWKSDLEQRDLALVWKAPEALRAGYAAQGITTDRDVIVYCNSGTEASHVYFALKYLLAYPRVRIYMGAWSEWAEREDLPVER